MKWSQLKKRIEEGFAPSVQGRVEVWNTRYRHSHDQQGEAWITVDKKQVWNMGTYKCWHEEWDEAERLRKERDADSHWEMHTEAEANVRKAGFYTLWELDDALLAYLSMSMDDIIASENPVVRALGMLDRRLGKRRLASVDVSDEHELVQRLHALRCEAEEMGKACPTH